MSYDNVTSRLYRTNGPVAGICSGLGERLGIDPVWVRIALIVTAICGGMGVLAYLIYWVVVPQKSAIVLEPATITPNGHRAYRRTTTDRKIAGVCAGLARTWNIDPSIVRFVAVALVAGSAGTMLVAYLLGAILMPASSPSVTTAIAL